MKTQEDQKIFELFYSGLDANDLLAFEIVKNQSKPSSRFGLNIFKKETGPNTAYLELLVCVAMSTLNKEFAYDVLEYLNPLLTEEQIRFVKRNIDIPNRGYFAPIALLRVFSKEKSLMVVHSMYKRTGKHPEFLLTVLDETEEDRAQVFDDFMENSFQSHTVYGATVPGLTKKEFTAFIEKMFISNQRPIIRSLNIESIKCANPPDLLFTKIIKDVKIKNTFTEKSFPDYVFRIKGLKELSIDIDENTVIPKDWSALSELTDLSINGAGHVFESFEFVKTLPKLKKIMMSRHQIKHPDILILDKVLPINSFIRFADDSEYSLANRNRVFQLPREKALSIAGALGKSILSKEESVLLFRKIIAVPSFDQLPSFSMNELMALMNVSNTALRSATQSQIVDFGRKQKSPKSLDKKSLLYIAGTPNRKKTEIKKKLKEIGIAIASKPEEAITHVVLGKNPKEYKVLQNRDLLLISEPDLYEKFKADTPGFIEETVQQGDTKIVENVLQFLYNDEPANINIGIEMLKTGGVPDELIDPLLIVFKTCPDAKTRGAAKKLLLRYAPADLQPLINETQRFTILNKKVRAQEINKKLEKVAKNTNRKLAAKLSLLLHHRFNKGLRYILYHFHEPCEERGLALEAMMEETHFNYAAGLGFTNHKGKSPETIWLTKMKTPAKFPVDVVDHVERVESANFHNCKLSALPKDIGKLKDLKKFDLSYNFLGSIPKSIEEMTQLEDLNLSANGFKTFPSTLKRLTNLKTLDLTFNMVNGEFLELEIPDDVKEALSGCSILV